jgi:hypothetical protein
VHPDVRKMLLTARAYAEGGRALAIYTALLIDKELSTDDEDERKEAADLVALLTPIIKAFLTDNGWIATSHCMQVFGGHGYIHEWGMEQFVRDARINMIYEGTNTVQSLDLLGRKVLGDNGAKLKKFGKLMQQFVEDEGTNEAMQEFVNPLADLGDKVTKLTMELGMKAMGNADEVGAAAVDYLRVVGHLVLRLLLGPHGQDRAGQAGHSGDPFYTAKLATARFYFAKLLPETASLIRSARSRPGAADGDGRSPVLRSPTMKPTLKPTIALALLTCAASAAIAQSTPVGLWKTIDDETKVEKSYVRIVEQGGVLVGRIEKLIDPPKADPVCEASAPTPARASPSSA